MKFFSRTATVRHLNFAMKLLKEKAQLFMKSPTSLRFIFEIYFRAYMHTGEMVQWLAAFFSITMRTWALILAPQ